MTVIRIPSDAVGQRINELRKKRGMSLKQLAERCAEVGADRLTTNAIENIEYGRRDKDGRRRREVTVDELLIFAYVLDVAPVHLLVPTTETAYPYVPQERIDEDKGWYPAGVSSRVRDWIRGTAPLPPTDLRTYFSEVPAEEMMAAVKRFADTQKRREPPEADDGR